MKKYSSIIRDACICLIVLGTSFAISLLLQYVFHVSEHVTEKSFLYIMLMPPGRTAYSTGSISTRRVSRSA